MKIQIKKKLEKKLRQNVISRRREVIVLELSLTFVSFIIVYLFFFFGVACPFGLWWTLEKS